MRRLRYICGGEDGRVERGSGEAEAATGAASVLGNGESDSWGGGGGCWCRGGDGVFEMLGESAAGGGAPFTTWSSFDMRSSVSFQPLPHDRRSFDALLCSFGGLMVIPTLIGFDGLAISWWLCGQAGSRQVFCSGNEDCRDTQNNQQV